MCSPTFVARGQQVDSASSLGLGASGALSVHGGFGRFKHASLGPEVGAALDLGWIGSRRVRLSLGVDYLSTTIDRPDSLGFPQHGTGYVFTALCLAGVVLGLITLGHFARRLKAEQAIPATGEPVPAAA